ncbi:MAG: CDP-glycerol glycerophosphotransferase family protein [Nocardioidaceae bacterium]|nr:CDP-glycerol glycerophosphotransferase family protein [Nocardioidaceae bacterium]
MVRALARHIRVYWLVGDQCDSLDWLVADADEVGSVRCLRKDSIKAYWAYLTARYVFFTHGLYGSPRPPPNKTFVNLWHGDGPKQRKNFAEVRSTLVVSGTELWGKPRARSFGVGESGVVITGNPRVDQFARPADDSSLRDVGIDPSKHFVLWLPTYRATEYRGRRTGLVRNWADAEELSNSELIRTKLTQVAEDARLLGVMLAVKPHHLDADQFADTGMHIISNADLRKARIGLYQLLARADGLVTDYSSVWTDFLAVNRPIGFYCPDLDEYVANRGLNVEEYPSLLPGPLLESREDFRRFMRDCLEESDSSRAQRSRSIDRIGAETRLGATKRLLDAVGITRSETPSINYLSIRTH